MSFGKMKRRPADKWWSDYIRANAKWRCEVCGKDYNHDHSKLDCVHYYGRRKESTRFDPENTLCGCKACHRRFHDYPSEHTDFMKKRLGKRFDALTIRANTPLRGTKAMQDEMVIIFCKQKLKNMIK